MIFTSSSKDLIEERDEAKEIETGPLSVLLQSVKQNTQVTFAMDILFQIDCILYSCFIATIYIFLGINQLPK